MIEKEVEEGDAKLKEKLEKKYINITKIGDGGSAVVYSGINRKTNEIEVMKVIDISSRTNHKLYENERKIAKRFAKQLENDYILYSKQSYIIKTSHKKYGILTLEKMDIDLLDYLLIHRKLNLPTAKNYFRQICQSISQSHSNSIAHLDIKPENILLRFSPIIQTSSWVEKSFSPALNENNVNNINKFKVHLIPPSESHVTIKLADFGFAHYWGPNESKSTKIKGKEKGTQQYCAPELFHTHSLSYSSKSITGGKFNMEKADIWSLGVLLFTMLTGCFPFILDSLTSQMKRLDIKQMKRLIGDDITIDLLTLMLNENYEQRPSVREVLAHPFFD